MKTKIVAVTAAALIILVIALSVTKCNNKPAIDPAQKTIDSLKLVIENKDAEIQKLDELVTYYAKEYDSTAKVNDSLATQGVKTITRYKTIKVSGDTSDLVAICDSMAVEYEKFIDQTKETLRAADSVMSAQANQIDAYKAQTATLKELVDKLNDKIQEQEREIDKWRKLAKRRGRAIEW